MPTSRSRSVPLAYRLCHSLQIDHFDCLLETYQPGMCVQGDLFGCSLKDPSIHFYINLYPNGSRPSFANWLSVFVHMLYEGRQDHLERICRLSFALVIPRNNADKNNKNGYLEEGRERTAWITLIADRRQSGLETIRANWGFRRFVNRAELSPYLDNNGTLRIVTRLVVCGSVQDIELEQTVLCDDEYQHRQTWTIDPMKVLIQQKKLTDFVLIGQNGEQNHTYRLLLAAHSPVFRTMFSYYENNDNNNNNNNSMELDEDGNVMAALLALISGSNDDDQLHQLDLNVKMLLLADKYMMESAKEQCEYRLMALLTPENVLAVVDALGLIQAPRLWIKSVELVRSHWDRHRVLTCEQWISLSRNRPDKAVELLCAVVSQCTTGRRQVNVRGQEIGDDDRQNQDEQSDATQF